MPPQKILIIRLSAIGDILLATPLLRALRTAFPAARVDFVVKSAFAEVLRHHPAIDTLHELNPQGGWPELRRLGQHLREMRYDAIFDIHKNFRSRYLTFAAKPQQILRYRKHIFRRWLFVNLKVNLLRQVPPIYRRYLNAARPLGITAPAPAGGRWLELFWRAEDERAADYALLARHWQPHVPLIGLAPGAGYFTKRWPVEYFGELAAALIRQGNHVAILGGTQDVQLGKMIEQKIALPQRTHLLNLVGELSLLGSAAVVKRCRVLVANDSGLMHIAEATGTPLLALFGSTTRELGFFPHLPTSRVVENAALACRPCSHLGHAQCPRRHFRCMRDLAPQEVLIMVQQMLLNNKAEFLSA
ncbi:MAG: ADP-heptose--LPS heptosyltransferase 2 [bacterium]|nr:ADP-heptose--LPS heptosyltransferase 2 [bacterium]